ncbi:MAG: biotin-dependent carboxyltransferase family protein [Proteobacteria bacterium]|nr:biotin-dependent carboxyltransferase family protein [Pseudomonadota bacterium]
MTVRPTSYLRILTPSPYSTIQDLGRPGYQALGVTDGGAMDKDALVLGNALVGNEAAAAGVEICLGGVVAMLEDNADNNKTARRIAITGSQATEIIVTDNRQNRHSLASNRSVAITNGSQIRIPPLSRSNCVFLAIEGGIGTPLIYGSRATSPNAQIGGIDGGRLLQKNDRLPLLPIAHADPRPNMHIADTSIFAKKTMFRIVFGPQYDRFTEEALRHFLTTPYQVTPSMNRMGMRLKGVRLTHTHSNDKGGDADIASDGIVAGAIQVAGDGMPIVLMADHQTTGGYTKIATIISSDVPALARLQPNDTIRFAAISVEEAEAAARAHADLYKKIIGDLQII